MKTQDKNITSPAEEKKPLPIELTVLLAVILLMLVALILKLSGLI
jgi:hypothetical protein